MKAYQLTESAMPQTVAIIFGRFNPPHKGHKHAWETASQVAEEWYVGTNKSTIGPDDPLPFEVKIEAMKAIMPEVAEHLVAEQSWWTLATYVFKKYGGVPGRTLPITLLVITDEPYVVPGLLKSNGQVSNHGEYSFQDIKLPFENIEQAKKHLRISSATALRNAVAAGDREGFANAAGVDADTPVAGHKFFDLVAHYLLPHREAQAAKDAAKAEKERLKAEKLAMKQQKAKGPAQELAESGICWKGYKRKPGTKKYSQGSCEKIEEIAGAFPSPSTRAQWAKDAAASNAAEARRQAELQRQANAARAAKLDANTAMVDRQNKINYHGANAPKPTNATWDGDSDFLELDGTKYAKASRMPIPGGEAPDMKLISTQEGWQVYIWTRNSLKGVVGRYFYPAPVKESRQRLSQALIEVEQELTEATNGQGNKMKGGTKPLDKEYKASMQNLSTMPDQNSSSGSAYLNYRMGIALAGAPDYPTKMSGDTWLGGDPLLSTYTPEELEMVKKASLQIGGGKIENWSGKRSEELPTVNKTSTVAKPKRNKYGV